MGKKKGSGKALKREGMSLRSVEEAKLGLATPNDRRYDALFAAAPDLMALCFAFARTVDDDGGSKDGCELRSKGDHNARTVRPTFSSELRSAMAKMAEQLRHGTVEAINQLLATVGEDSNDEIDVSAARTKLHADLHALVQLASDGVRLVDEAHRRHRNYENVPAGGPKAGADELGGHTRREEAQIKDEEEEEDERLLLASMRGACGLLENLYAQALCASSETQIEGLSTSGAWAPLGAQVVSQLVSVVDSVVSAGRVLDHSARHPQGLGLHLAGAVDAQLHLLSVLLRGDSGQVEARRLHQHAGGIQFLAAMLELEYRVTKLEPGKPDQTYLGELCRRAADVAGRLRRLGDAAERQEDLDELNHLGIQLAVAADESRRLAARASHVTGTSLLPGKGPATPKLPREDPSSKWDWTLGVAAAGQSAGTVESTIMPAVVDNSRLLTSLAAHRLATSRDALNCLTARQTPDEAPVGPSHCAQLRRIFRRCGTLSALAASLVADRSAVLFSSGDSRRLCEVGVADFVRQQIYAAVFEVNKLSLLLQTVCSTLDASAAARQKEAGLGTHHREAAVREQCEELADRVSARLNRFEAAVAAALPPTPAEQLRVGVLLSSLVRPCGLVESAA
jgi:hypothetical protein